MELRVTGFVCSMICCIINWIDVKNAKILIVLPIWNPMDYLTSLLDDFMCTVGGILYVQYSSFHIV